MPLAKLNDHLKSVSERLDMITVELLSEGQTERSSLMAERRLLLADVTRTCRKLDGPSVGSSWRSSLGFPRHLQVVK